MRPAALKSRRIGPGVAVITASIVVWVRGSMAGGFAAPRASWVLAWLLFHVFTCARDPPPGGLVINEPRTGALLVDGRTVVAWRLDGCPGLEEGAEVHVELDGETLVTLVPELGQMPAITSMHLLGAPHGPHTIRVTASARVAAAPQRDGRDSSVPAQPRPTDDDGACTDLVHFISVPPDAGEHTAALAALRARPQRPDSLLAELDRSLPPLPPPSRTNWTRLVPPSVLTGHVSSLLPY
jgi:hypothetical protein